MKHPFLINRDSRVFSISELFLLYGLYAIICYTVCLILYEQISISPSAPFPRLTVVETSIALDHLWMGFFMILTSAFIICKAEKTQKN